MNLRMEALRSELDRPFLQRSFLFVVLTPLLYSLALLYSLLLEFRLLFLLKLCRKRGFDLPVVSVGNIAVGGTGKSPLIRKLANDFLQRGYTVCVLSRGYGAGPNSQGIYFESNALESEYESYFANAFQDTQKRIRRLSKVELSDEALELLYLLKRWNKEEPQQQKPFVIAQFAKRSVLVEALTAIFSESFGKRKSIVLLDDAMQHVQCSRDLDICVWSLEQFHKAPRYCFPLGSYREGFGPFFKRVTRRAQIHVWNQAQDNSSELHKDSLLSLAQDQNLFPGASHWLMAYGSSWAKQVCDAQGVSCDLVYLAEGECPKLDEGSEWAVVTGIGAPQRFVKHLLQSYEKERLQLRSNVFSDHEPYSERIGAVFRQAKEQRFFLTLKDWLRWRSSAAYCRDTRYKDVYVCLVEAKVLPLQGTQELSDLLLSVLVCSSPRELI